MLRYDPKALRRFREKRALSLEALARAAGLSLRQTAYLDAGEREPRAGTLARLASALGVGVEAFFRSGGKAPR